MISLLKRWFGAKPPGAHDEFTVVRRELPLKQVIADEDDDLAWFWPPSTIADVAAWDKYWSDQISHRLAPALFDFINNGSALAAAMSALGMRSILCAGSGISQEPRAFAEAGFTVTAMDPSSVAMEYAQAWNYGPQDYEINMHTQPRRERGRVEFVTGDILNPEICPGPFDVVIERRMLQLFEVERRPTALAALASRMKENAILLSHTHHGHWRPEQDRTHPLQSLFLEGGWQLWNPHDRPKPSGRVAWLYFTTG